jgi:hypothetical protein
MTPAKQYDSVRTTADTESIFDGRTILCASHGRRRPVRDHPVLASIPRSLSMAMILRGLGHQSGANTAIDVEQVHLVRRASRNQDGPRATVRPTPMRGIARSPAASGEAYGTTPGPGVGWRR